MAVALDLASDERGRRKTLGTVGSVAGLGVVSLVAAASRDESIVPPVVWIVSAVLVGWLAYARNRIAVRLFAAWCLAVGLSSGVSVPLLIFVRPLAALGELVSSLVSLTAAAMLFLSPDVEAFLEAPPDEPRSPIAERVLAAFSAISKRVLELRSGTARERLFATAILAHAASMVAYLLLVNVTGGSSYLQRTAYGPTSPMYELERGAIVVLIVLVATIFALRDSPYATGGLFGTSVSFAFSAAHGTYFALAPVPHVERGIPQSIGALGVFSLVSAFCAVGIALGHSRKLDSVNPVDRHLRAGLGAFVGLFGIFVMGRPPLLTCRTEREPETTCERFTGPACKTFGCAEPACIDRCTAYDLDECSKDERCVVNDDGCERRCDPPGSCGKECSDRPETNCFTQGCFWQACPGVPKTACEDLSGRACPASGRECQYRLY